MQSSLPSWVIAVIVIVIVVGVIVVGVIAVIIMFLFPRLRNHIYKKICCRYEYYYVL